MSAADICCLDCVGTNDLIKRILDQFRVFLKPGISKTAYFSPTLTPDKIPAPPTRPQAMLDRIFPYKLGIKTTSN
uniref:Uncharacterized protein n=1 Tax=Romanomermis culicivorax TaxID=13658 RepID=A0A915KDU1_ROMCU